MDERVIANLLEFYLLQLQEWGKAVIADLLEVYSSYKNGGRKGDC